MDEVVTWWFSGITPWHWWAVAVLLVVLEVFVTSTYLIWPAGASAAVGFALWVFPNMDWRIQLAIFAVVSLIAIIGWTQWQKKHQAENEETGLNTRAMRNKGRKLTLEEALSNGRGRVQMDDTYWLVASEDGSEIAAGTTVEIVSADGATLLIKPV